MTRRTDFLAILLVAASMLASFQTSKQQDPLSVAVMTFNIRYNNPDDAPNHWENRRDWVGELIHFYNPDFVGTQEVLHGQLTDMLDRLPAYANIGVAREDGKQNGEYSAILYKKAKYDLLRSATFWLSETPEKPGIKGWDAANVRIVTWGEFKDKASGNTFFFFNTHFDHRGEKARKESAKLLLKKVHEIAGNEEAIITGDFNTTPESQVYQWLTSGYEEYEGLYDSFSLASKPYGPIWTAHSFGKAPVEKRNRIDYIFANKKVDIKKYHAIAEQRGEIFPSDHLPVMAEIILDE